MLLQVFYWVLIVGAWLSGLGLLLFELVVDFCDLLLEDGYSVFDIGGWGRGYSGV